MATKQPNSNGLPHSVAALYAQAPRLAALQSQAAEAERRARERAQREVDLSLSHAQSRDSTAELRSQLSVAQVCGPGLVGAGWCCSAVCEAAFTKRECGLLPVALAGGRWSLRCPCPLCCLF